MAKLSKMEQVALNRLPEIVAATNAGSCVYAEKFDMAYLIDEGLAEAFDDYTNPENAEEVAIRATQKGIDSVASETTASATNQPEKAKSKGSNKMSFKIENIPVAAGKRGGGSRTAKYPFDALEVGQSFFVAATEDHPEPAKSLASALTNAMKKYDVPLLDEAGVQKTKAITVPKTGEKRTILATKHTRVFVANAVIENDVKGARIGRTA